MVATALTMLAARGTAQPAPRQVRWIQAGRLLDVETGTLRENVLIEIRGDRIVAVRDAGSGPAPPADSVVRLERLTVLPGLIDSHVHLTLGGRADSNARATLLAGFTTVQDLGALDYANLAVRDSIAGGAWVGPRVVASGPWLGRSGGTCDFNGIGVRGPEAFGARAREDLRRGADVVKVCVTSWPAVGFSNPDSVEISEAELAAAAEVVRSAGRSFVVHAIGAAGVRLAVGQGARAVVHSGFADDATLAKMKRRDTYLIPTLASFARARGQPFGQALFERMRRAFSSGGPIAFGTDAGVIPHGRNAREFSLMTELGLTPIAAIRAATIDAAHLLGRSSDLGAIGVGRYADVIAVDGNPLEDITALERVVFVMKGGVVFTPLGRQSGTRSGAVRNGRSIP